MNSDTVFQKSLSKLLIEIFEGPPADEAYMLNPGDPGLLNQLDQLSAQTASSRPTAGKTTVAAHVDHVLYGLRLLNRWIDGEENPWKDADWSASWKRGIVTDEQWNSLRQSLFSQKLDDLCNVISSDIQRQFLKVVQDFGVLAVLNRTSDEIFGRGIINIHAHQMFLSSTACAA